MAPLKFLALALVPVALANGTPITVGDLTVSSDILPGETNSVKFGPLTQGPPLVSPTSGMITLAPGPVVVSTLLSRMSDASQSGDMSMTMSGPNTMITATPPSGVAPASASASAASAASSAASVASSAASAASSASRAASASSAVATGSAPRDQQVAMGALVGGLGIAMLL